MSGTEKLCYALSADSTASQARPEAVEWLLLSFECNLQTLKHAEGGVMLRDGSKIMENYANFADITAKMRWNVVCMDLSQKARTGPGTWQK